MLLWFVGDSLAQMLLSFLGGVDPFQNKRKNAGSRHSLEKFGVLLIDLLISQLEPFLFILTFTTF